MKQLLSLCMIINLLFCIPEASAKKYYFGISGGMNFADLNLIPADETDTDFDVRSRPLYTFGAIAGARISGFLTLQLEPTYIKKGGIYTEPVDPDLHICNSYIEIPLLVKAHTGNRVQVYLLAGPYISFLMNARVDVEMAGLPMTGDLSPILAKTEYGFTAGPGISTGLWKGSIFLECRYTRGLNNVNLGGSTVLEYEEMIFSGPDPDPGDIIKSKGIQILLGFQVPIGK